MEFLWPVLAVAVLILAVLLAVMVRASHEDAERSGTTMLANRLVRGGRAPSTALAKRPDSAKRIATMPAPRRPALTAAGRENLIVDTLNLVHWLKRRAPLKRLSTCDILLAIEITAPILRRQFPGRVIYVTKDRETATSKEAAAQRRALYQSASRRCGVYIHIVEKLPEQEGGSARSSERVPNKVGSAEREDGSARARMGGAPPKKHAALGRDDFYLIMLAWKLRSPVLSQDRFRDLADMKSGALEPFHVYSFSPVKDSPERDFVNPAAAEFARMRRPVTVDYADVLPHL